MAAARVHRWVLPNGLTVLYRQSPGFPLAAAGLLLRTGTLYESPSEAGLANFTIELMLQGTRQRSARQIAEEIEERGASLGAQGAEDYGDIGLVGPEGEIGQVFDVLVETLTEPAFPAREIEKERASILASLASRQDTIFTRAYDALNRLLYRDHPYGRPVEGTADTVKRFQRANLQDWHRQHIRPDRAILSFISSMPATAARRLSERHFVRWERTPAGVNVRRMETPALPRRGQRLVLKAPFEQAYLMVGMPAPSVISPAFMTLKVLNTLLGGGMSSRLFVELREEKGLAYEVSSFYPTHLTSSQWVIYLGLPPSKLGIARRTLDNIFENLERHGPTPKEVHTAIQMLKGAYLMDHQTRRRQAWYAAWWEFLGKPPQQEDQFCRDVEAVTVGNVRDLARKLLAQPRVVVEVLPGKR